MNEGSSSGSKGDNQDAYNINSKIVGVKYAFNDSALANVEYRIIESDLREDTEGIYDEEQSQISLGVKFNF